MSRSIIAWPKFHTKDKHCCIRQIHKPCPELTSEILRLFALDPHDNGMLEATGVGKDEMAAYRFSTLSEPGGALFVAEQFNRLDALLFMAPDLMLSAVLGHHFWSIRQLVVSASAPRATVAALLDTAMKRLNVPLDCIIARVPARDWPAVRGLQEQGFEAVDSEVISVLPCEPREIGNPSGTNLTPIRRVHLSKAADLIRRCAGFLHVPSSVQIRASQVTRLYECLLASYVVESNAGGLVAETKEGKLIGFITYKTNNRLDEFTRPRLASLYFSGIHPDFRHNGLNESLHKKTISALYAHSVDFILARTSVTRPEAVGKFELMKSLGCRSFSSELIFQRWLTS